MKRLLLKCVLIVLPVLIFCTCTINVPGVGFFTVSFIDTDMGSGQIAGTLTITPVETEDVVSHFTVYWGSSETEKLAGSDRIAEIAVTGAAIEYVIAENTAIPAGAAFLLIYAKNETGESETAAYADIIDKGSTVTVSLSTGDLTISSYVLMVSGSDMDTITQTVAGTESDVVLEITDGTARTFSATATVDPSDPGVLLELSGTDTIDLTAGTAASVTVNFNQIEDLKIVIPDSLNYRIVQIDNMSGDNWLEKEWDDIGLAADYLRPNDIDFDADGKIYFANNYASTEFGRVFVLDNMADTSVTGLPDQGSGITSLAVDRVNALVYYSDGSNLWRCDLDGTNGEALSLAGTTIAYVRGIDVDNSGILYISGNSITRSSAVFKYNPATETEIAKNEHSELSTAYDIIVKGADIYVANYWAADGYQIMQFDTALDFVDSFGDHSDMPPSGSETTDFFWPRRFIAIPAKKITIIDENDNSGNADRIASFSDIDGSEWETFTPSDVGESAFEFFDSY